MIVNFVKEIDDEYVAKADPDLLEIEETCRENVPARIQKQLLLGGPTLI